MTGTGAQEGNADVPESRAPVILHLSDLHFTQGENLLRRTYRRKLLDQLIAVVAGQGLDWRPSIICVSGDIGGRNGGGDPDYEAAQEWLSQLLDALEIAEDRLVLCPGNHDVDRSVLERVLSELELADPGSDRDTLFSDGIPEALRPAFSEYVALCESLGVPGADFAQRAEHLSGVREVGGVRFVILNSAWFSLGGGDRGTLHLGRDLVRSLPLPLVRDDHLTTVAVFHHPFDFLCDGDNHTYPGQPATKGCLTAQCHLVLTGHAHGTPGPPDHLAMRCLHINGGAAYDGPSRLNSMRLIQIRSGNCMMKTYRADPSAPTPQWEQVGEIETLPLGRSEERTLNAYSDQVSVPAIEEELEDPAEKLRGYTERLLVCIDRREFREGYRLAVQALGWLERSVDERDIDLDTRRDFRMAAGEAQMAWAVKRRNEERSDWRRIWDEAKRTVEGIDDGS